MYGVWPRYWVMLVCLIVTATGCTLTSGARQRTAAGSVREETVHFPGDNVQLAGVLFTPDTPVPSRGRRPALVLLHGCSGMVNARGQFPPARRDWAEHFARAGFMALAVDSFRPRGVGSVCELKERPADPWHVRAADAYAALDYLVRRADVDPENVFVIGWSHGGSTVLGVVRPEARGQRASGPPFRAAVAFYPGCNRPLRQPHYRTTMPLLILHGEADDWVPAAPCVELAHKLQHAPFPVTTIVYPGAHHGFDARGGAVRWLPNIYNPGMPGERGAHVGAHEPSWLQAVDATDRFLAQHLAR